MKYWKRMEEWDPVLDEQKIIGKTHASVEDRKNMNCSK